MTEQMFTTRGINCTLVFFFSIPIKGYCFEIIFNENFYKLIFTFWTSLKCIIFLWINIPISWFYETLDQTEEIVLLSMLFYFKVNRKQQNSTGDFDLIHVHPRLHLSTSHEDKLKNIFSRSCIKK